MSSTILFNHFTISNIYHAWYSLILDIILSLASETKPSLDYPISLLLTEWPWLFLLLFSIPKSWNAPGLSPLFFGMYTHSHGAPVRVVTVGNIIFLLNTAKFLSPTLELHTHASICLIYISTWMSSIHLQLSMSETILLISCSFPSLLYLGKWPIHLSCCSGQTNLVAILDTLLSS